MRWREMVWIAGVCGWMSAVSAGADEPKPPTKDDKPAVEEPAKADANDRPRAVEGATRREGDDAPRGPDQPRGPQRDGPEGRPGPFGPPNPNGPNAGGPNSNGPRREGDGFRRDDGPFGGPFRGEGPDGRRMPGPPGEAGFGPRGGFGGPRSGLPHGDLESMQESDPEMYALAKDDHDLDRRTLDLSHQYRRAAAEAERTRLRAELEKAVENHFNVRQQRRELELRRLEEQLNRMKDQISKRKEQRDAVIKQRLNELTGENETAF